MTVSLLEAILNAPAVVAVGLLLLLAAGYALYILHSMSSSLKHTHEALSSMNVEIKELRKELTVIALEVREHSVRIENLEERS